MNQPLPAKWNLHAQGIARGGGGGGRPSESRESICATCRKFLKKINSGVVNIIPIKLEKLNFKVYAKFLSTFKKTVKKRNIVGTVIESNSSVDIRFSPSSYDASYSSLSNLYIEC